MANNERFDEEAAEWDNNPVTVQSSKLALEALLDHVSELESAEKAKTLDVLEIGCGTGLLTLQIAPLVHSVTAIDTSSGMIHALSSKLATSNTPTNIHPLTLLLEDPSDPALEGRKFDLIISHLVLHHIPSLSSILTTMYACLKPRGRIALTDFERFGPQSRLFHPESKMEGVERHGITKMEMECLIKDAGFDEVRVSHAFDLEKSVEEEGGKTRMMEFPFLICMGLRKR